MFDFFIIYRLDKINFIDTLLRRFNYKNKNKLFNYFLFIL